MSAVVNVQKKDKYAIHVILVLAITFGFRFIPAPAPITETGMALIGIFFGMIYGWLIAGQNLVWPSLLALFALATTDYGTAVQVSQKAFGSEMVVLMISSMMIIGAASSCNVSNYLVVKLISARWAQGRPWMLTFVFIAGAMVLGLVINPIVAGLFLATVLSGVFEEVGYKPGDAYPVMTNIGIFLAVILDLCLIPWGVPLMAFGAMKGIANVVPDYGYYFMTATPYVMAVVIGYTLFMRLMRCDASKIANADFTALNAQYQMGLNKTQKMVVSGLVIMLVGSIAIAIGGGGTSAFSILLGKVNVYGWMMIVCAAFMMIRVEGKPLLSLQDAAKSVDWNTIFVIATAMTVAGALTADTTGVSAFLVKALEPVLANLGTVPFYIALAIIALVLTNFFNNIVIITICAAVAGSLYTQGVEINLQIAAATIGIMAGTGILTPSASAFGAMLHTNKFSVAKQMYKYAGATLVYLIVTYIVIYLPLAFLMQ